MKKIILLFLSAFSGLIIQGQTPLNFNICGYVSSFDTNTPAINATVTGYVSEGNGTTLGQFSTTTDTSGNFCTQYYNVTPDTSGCSNLNITISVSNSACNTTQSYNFGYWLCNDTSIWVDINGCDTTVGCSVYITDSLNNGNLFAQNYGTAPYAYQWSTGEISAYIFANAFGQYCVTVTDANGCVASECYYYGQNSCNLSAILLLDSTPCMGPMHSLGSAVYGATGAVSYLWSTGDTGQFICNLYPGNYCLTVTDSIGCTYTDCYYIQSSGSCYISIYQLADSSTGADYLFADFSGGTPLSYQWQANGTVLDTTNTFYPNYPGTYCVVVSDDSGCTATACYDYGQNTSQCYVYFSSYEDSTSPGMVYLTSYPGGTAPFTYYWTFSDGTVDTLENPVHVFTQTNSWDYACLEVTDATGCMSSYCDYVYTSGGGTVVNCYASFSGYFDDITGTAGEVFFTDYSWGANGQVVSWNWDFGDGTGSSLQNPSHTFSSTGNYTICLTIADGNGCSSGYCETWYVDTAWWGTNPWGNGTSCDAQFISMQDSTVPGMVYLVDLSYGNNLFYTWTFVSADGTINQTISTQYPFINFTQFGCFNVCLTVTDTLGNCQDSFCDSVCVDSLGNLSKATNWGLTVIPSAVPVSLLSSTKEEMRSQLTGTVSVFPNPANDELNLKVSLAKSENVQIEMIDFTGRSVYSLNKNFKEGVNNFKLDLGNNPSGIYFVKFNSEHLHHSEKIVKMN